MTPSRHTLADLRAGRLAGTAQLDLRHCQLEEFPREIFDLADTLTMLDLSGNRLRTLPDDLPRLRALRILFCSSNPFETLPAVLGRCEGLDIVGFKSNAIARVPPESLPAGLARCERLELIRLSANRFETAAAALPEGLLALPRLAWLAYAGNPFNAAQEARALERTPIASVPWDELQLGELLGAGASGHIHAAQRRHADGRETAVAVKLFKGAITSDGLPASEMAACIAAGTHPHLIGVEGRVARHPQHRQGLVLGLIPPRYRSLAGPPSLASCTRDVYAPERRFTAAQAHAIAQGTGDALAHLHERGLVHGDFYAHNILVDDDAHALLGDFGAASFLPERESERAEALRRIDERALEVLVSELDERAGL